MLLFLWINKYKHIQKTGFNLSSLYEFDFLVEESQIDTKRIIGKLQCIKKSNANIFNSGIEDIKAIIGENGSGKSTILEVLIQNIMSKPTYYFDGFLVTDKFVFNRKGIHFGDSISKINYFNLKEVSNVELVNYNREFHERKLKSEEVKDHYQGQIATSHLNNLSIVHYSPLLNLDRIGNVDGIAGSSVTWETDFWHYYDYTTENCIVNDYYATLNTNSTSYSISGESELLAHKSMESKRNLEFLSNEISTKLPFKNNIDSVTIRLNDFYLRFWQSVDRFFKSDNELQGRIESVITSIEEKDLKEKDTLKELESNLYISFIYGALKYEYNNRMNFGNRGKSNAIISTIDLFLSSTSKTRIHKTTLQNFLKNAQFTQNLKSSLFNRIKKAVDFIINANSIIDRSKYDFKITISNPETIREFIKILHDDFILKDRDVKRSFIFSIFSIEYDGLSSGERNLLSMFSRFQNASDTIPSTQTDIVFLLDEPEVTLHPQWQTKFIKLLNDNLPNQFPNKRIQILISSHSPILVSDLPKNNILFLEKGKKGECKVSDLKNMQNTFGANIHTLYAEAFFLEDKGGAMGEFAKEKIKNLIRQLHEEIEDNPNTAKAIINIIGEPLIQNQLIELFYKKYPEQRVLNIDTRIEFLEKQLISAKELKQKMDNEKNR